MRTSSRSRALAVALGLIGVLTLAPAANATEGRWQPVERYYLGLLNCTRTGGWVRADGSCDGYGSGKHSAYRKPFERLQNLSRNVARPYAKLMADRGEMSHYLDGSPPDRMRRAGYRQGRVWGENIGYWAGDPYQAVLNIHRHYQSEKPYDGIHWRTIKNRQLKFVGIGIWRKDGYTYLVTDFWDPT